MNHLWTKWINAATIKTISQSVSLMQQFTTEDKLFDWLADRMCQTDQHKTLSSSISSKLCRSAPETRRRFCNWSFSDPDQYFDIIFDPLVICVLRHFSLISDISVCFFIFLKSRGKRAEHSVSLIRTSGWPHQTVTGRTRLTPPLFTNVLYFSDRIRLLFWWLMTHLWAWRVLMGQKRTWLLF